MAESPERARSAPREHDGLVEQRLTAAIQARDRALAEAGLLNQINAAAAGEDRLDRILAAALDNLRHLVPFTGGSIALVEDGVLVCVAAVGPFAETALGQRQPRGAGRLWQVVERVEPFLSGDVLAEGLKPSTPLRSYLAVPLVWRGAAIGVLEVDSTETDAFDAADLDLLRMVAVALAGPIQLARRFADQAERQRLLRQILDVLPEGLVIADRSGRVTTSNAAARAILGIDLQGEALPIRGDPQYGMRALDGTPIAPEMAPLARAIRMGEAVQGEQVLVKNGSDGRELPLLLNAAALRDETGSVIGGVAAFQDITAIRELERSREELLSSISHDLKTPLTSIKGFAQLLRRRAERTPGDATVEVLAGIETSAAKMERMLAELLDVARMQMGQALELDRRPVDLLPLVRQEVAARQTAASHHRLLVETDLEELVGVWDAARLERVLGNLLTNAVKYSPNGGTIAIAVGREQGSQGPLAVLSVRDEGIGIPAVDLPHIFDRFYRAHNVVGRVEGMGIGLASIHQIVVQHGGTLDVQSAEGRGSTFTVRLPLEAPESAQS